MYKLIATLFICTGLFATPALAGSGHEHGHGHSHGPVNAHTAANRAAIVVNKLVEDGKVDASWRGIKPTSVEQKTYEGQKEWVITFKNDKVKDKSKQTLYLFFSLDGNYIAANYTGQ